MMVAWISMIVCEIRVIEFWRFSIYDSFVLDQIQVMGKKVVKKSLLDLKPAELTHNLHRNTDKHGKEQRERAFLKYGSHVTWFLPK